MKNENQLLIKQICLVHFRQIYYCLSHDFLLARLHSYGFRLSVVKLIHSYLKKRKQKTKTCLTYNSWEEIPFGVPQRFILGPLLVFFSINESDIASFADDILLHVTGNSIEDVTNSFENYSIKLFK